MLPALALVLAGGTHAQTYTNGPLITHPGGGFGGANASALENVSPLFLNVFGFSAANALGNRLADDFTVPCGQSWTINQIRVYGYQTQATPSTISTLSAANYRIWNGPPNAGGTVLFDFSASSQMLFSDFALNTYRVAMTPAVPGLVANNRPIFTAYMLGNSIVLPPGTYWLDFALTGTLASGPFVPPITILGQGTTGNALQAVAGVWGSAEITSGGIFAQGVPFQIWATVTPVPCFDLNITQAFPGSGIFLTDSGGTPGNTALNVIALVANGFPNGWLFGIDIEPNALVTQYNSGPPFNVTLNGSGGYSIGPIGAPPVPIPLYYVGIELDSSGNVVTNSPAKTITVSP
jgi:hypothetical protein